MRRGVLALVVAAAVSACGGHAPPSISRPTAPAERAEPRLVGRFDRGRGDAAGFAFAFAFAWSGSTVELRFRGRAVAVRLRADPLPRTAAGDEPSSTYGVTLDGRAMPALDVREGEHRYVAVEGLDPGATHELALTRDAEASGGVHQLLGIDVEGGVVLPPRARARSIEVIGDSIACGYGILGADATCRFSYATERASLAYPALVGRALDLDVTTVAWSGRGVLRNFDGSTSGTMPELYERTLPGSGTHPSVPFDFAAAREPDVVVAALGTNDFLGGKDALDLGAFEAAYVAFLGRVRAVRPHAWILVAESPMLPPEPPRELGTFPGNAREAARASLGRVVEERRAAGDGRVELVPLPWQGARRGCDHHPNAEMHRELAERLGAVLRTKLDL